VSAADINRHPKLSVNLSTAQGCEAHGNLSIRNPVVLELGTNDALAPCSEGSSAGLTASEIAALHVGVSASVSGATGAPETFNVAQAQVTAIAVPEPGITLLLRTALIGVAWSYRRTRR
jgi:hypothetical protein